MFYVFGNITILIEGETQVIHNDIHGQLHIICFWLKLIPQVSGFFPLMYGFPHYFERFLNVSVCWFTHRPLLGLSKGGMPNHP